MNSIEIEKRRKEAWDRFYAGKGKLTINDWAEIADELDDIINDIIVDLSPEVLE